MVTYRQGNGKVFVSPEFPFRGRCWKPLISSPRTAPKDPASEIVTNQAILEFLNL